MTDRAPTVFHDEIVNVERPDADLYAERVGPDDAPVVYFLHGGPGYSSHSLRETMGEELEGLQLIYADQRGGGRSYGAGSDDPSLLASDVAAVMNAYELESAHLLGHGFGAMVAVQTALQYPHLVKSLVLVNPWFSLPLLARDLLEEAQRLAGITPADGGAGTRADGTPVHSGAGSDPTGQEDEASMSPEADVDAAFALVNPKTLFDALEFPKPAARLQLEHADAQALFGPSEEDEPVGVWRLDILERLPELKLPVVVISGQLDGTSFPSQVEAGLTRMPGALVSLLDCGHYPWLEDPELFLSVLEQALAADEAPS